MIKVAVDAMGGDYAPLEVIKGSYQASSEFKDVDVILVGKEPLIKDIIRKECPGFNPRIVHAPEQVEMGEPAALSIRRKKFSSVVLGLGLVKNNEAQAFVSCGNTGALVCGAVVYLGLIEGVERPGLAIIMPTLKGSAMLIDVGANIDPKPKHLMQYALMADVYSRKILDKQNPAVGILNIGEEETKGPEFIKETLTLLKGKLSNFQGNIEAKDIFSGEYDCIICDGLAGNIALKVTEGFASAVKYFLLSEVKKDFLGIFGLYLVKRSLRRFSKLVDYAEYGGAPLLGVDGVVIIGHGRSKAKAVKNAIRAGALEIKRNVSQEIKQKLNECA